VSGKGLEPFAWAVIAPDCQYVSLFRESAEAAAAQEGGTVVPIYRHPTLTDEEPVLTDLERAVIERSSALHLAKADVATANKQYSLAMYHKEDAKTLDGLLKRVSLRS